MGQDDGRSLAGRATPAEPVVSALREGIANAPRGWDLVTYYRELRPWLTEYRELERKRYRWKWLAHLMKGGTNVLRDGDRRWLVYEAVEPAQGMETGTAKTEGLGPKDDSPVGTMRPKTQGIQP